jgi:transposase-like protein
MEDEEHLLTFYAFLQVMHRYIRTTNAIESFFSNVRQRTDQIDAFTTETRVSDHRLGDHASNACAQDSSWLNADQ